MVNNIVVEDMNSEKALCSVYWSGGPLIIERAQWLDSDSDVKTDLQLLIPFDFKETSSVSPSMPVDFNTILACDGLLTKITETDEYRKDDHKTMNLLTLLE